MAKKNHKWILFIIVIFLIGFGIGYFYQLQPEQKIITQPVQIENFSFVEMSLPAVDEKGNGVAVDLSVEARSGAGRILTNIDKLLFWIDTQYSIQTAKAVAENITGLNTSNIDLIYTINTNATIVGGPSAGAAMTVATIAALENKKLNSSVIITGTINPDGSIGKVGAILEKAKAAKDINKTLFLVPQGEGIETKLKPVEKCIRQPGFTYCETTYEKIEVNVGERIGIDVKEVANINDALKYFLL